FQISKTYSDPEGRFIICDLTVNGKQLTLTNIYAPNNDDSNFFTSVFSHLADFNASESLDLIDAWRVLNPDSSKFTWRQRKPEIHCRLDFFLINQCTFCNIINAEILAGYKTDHSMITLQISLHSNTRGRGFWKLNTSFLTETEYVNQIK
ncbi:unnamed protein product, partial [Porites evermanni]